MATKPKLFGECQKLRRMLIRHDTLNTVTGETTRGEEEWVTRECGVPLFADAEKQSGLCRSCAKGWTHPNNYPADEPQPEKEGVR